MLTNVHIEKAIKALVQQRSERTQVKAERVVTELTKVPFANIYDFVLERCHRVMARSFAFLEARRSNGAPSASVVVGQAGQVNVDCAVMNKAGR